MLPKLSVIIPCYNEEKRFKNGYFHYISYLKTRKYPWEIILVNDGSKDSTLKIMKNLTANTKNVRIVSYKKNVGKGYAVVQGVKAAKGKYILFTDLDHSVPIETIDSFFSYFTKGDNAVVGSRRVKGSKLVVRQPKIREYLGRGFTLLVRLLIDWKIKDSTCGFKAFENKTAKKLFSKITIYDWAFDAEILFLLKKFNLKYAQAPVAWTNVGGSQVRLKKDIIRSFFGLIKIRINNFKGIYDR